ncbi:MAG: AMP-binding protein [Alphaproteobacteria bacterium]|nr:AMP-binding protein [Alphaproteobacteria bacterium]
MGDAAVSIADLLRQRAAATPDAVAVHFPDPVRAGVPPRWTSLTFAAIDAAADAYARGFVAAGIRAGDRVLLLVRPSSDFYALVFGLVRTGAVPVFIDPGMGPASALRCVTNIAPDAMIAIPPVHVVRTFHTRPFRTVRTAITAGRTWWWGGPTLKDCAMPGDGPFHGPPVQADDDAVIVFTSGSTGTAKAVSMSHRTMAARVAHIQALFDLQPGEVILETLLVYTMLEVCMGLTVVIPPMDIARPATVDPADVVTTFQRFDPAIGSASPVVWHKLVRHCVPQGVRLSSPRMLLTTAAPIPVDLHRRLGEVFPPGVELFTPYGATEALPIARIGSAEILGDTAERTGRGAGTCVGALAPGIDVRIVDLVDGPIATMADARVLPVDAIGEIVVRGDGVSRAYRNSPAGNAAAKIADGDDVWHRMGDLGYLDDAGRLWFCGRTTHRVESRDGRIPAVCVEGIFNVHPDVFRTALVGVGPAGAEVPVLCVELEAGRGWSPGQEKALLALADDTPYAGVVRRVLVHPRFPTDTRHNSKIRREDLKVWAERQSGVATR